MKKLIAVFTLALAATAFAPRPAAAQHADCVWDYVSCLNDSYELEGVFETMADIECFSEYLKCLGKGIVTR